MEDDRNTALSGTPPLLQSYLGTGSIPTLARGPPPHISVLPIYFKTYNPANKPEHPVQKTSAPFETNPQPDSTMERKRKKGKDQLHNRSSSPEKWRKFPLQFDD